MKQKQMITETKSVMQHRSSKMGMNPGHFPHGFRKDMRQHRGDIIGEYCEENVMNTRIIIIYLEKNVNKYEVCR